MKTVRRDKLQRDIEAGRVEARLVYDYDGRAIHSGSEWKPAVVAPCGQRGDAYTLGVVYFDPMDFKYKTGCAWQEPDGIISFCLPGSEHWWLRYREAA